MRPSISFRAKRELLAQISGRYRDATSTHKSQILDEFVAATGYARKYAIRLLRALVLPVQPITRPRPRSYGKEVQQALAMAWAAANYDCAKRLVPCAVWWQMTSIELKMVSKVLRLCCGLK